MVDYNDGTAQMKEERNDHMFEIEFRKAIEPYCMATAIANKSWHSMEGAVENRDSIMFSVFAEEYLGCRKTVYQKTLQAVERNRLLANSTECVEEKKMYEIIGNFLSEIVNVERDGVLSSNALVRSIAQSIKIDGEKE